MLSLTSSGGSISFHPYQHQVLSLLVNFSQSENGKMVCYCGLIYIYLIKNTVIQINTSEVEPFLTSIGHMYVFYELSAHDLCPFFYWGVALCFLKPPVFLVSSSTSWY